MTRGLECSYDKAAVEGRLALPLSAEASHPTGAEPSSGAGAFLGFGNPYSVDEVFPNGDLEFVNHPGFGEAPFHFVGNEPQLPGVATLRYLNQEVPNLDDFFRFEDAAMDDRQAPTDASLALHHHQDKESRSWCLWIHSSMSFAIITEKSAMMQDPKFAALQPAALHALRSANLIIQSLRAFPTMMLRRETFPWFIHPHSHLLAESPEAVLPEALTNCMSIAQMFVSQTPETRHLLRRTMTTEYRRWTIEVRYYPVVSSTYADIQKDGPDV
jgi:hypothetical protein